MMMWMGNQSNPHLIWRDGRVWFMAAVLKTAVCEERTVGSNPTLAAKDVAVPYIAEGVASAI